MCTVLFDRFRKLGECFEVSKPMLSEMFPVDIEDPPLSRELDAFRRGITFNKAVECLLARRQEFKICCGAPV